MTDHEMVFYVAEMLENDGNEKIAKILRDMADQNKFLKKRIELLTGKRFKQVEVKKDSSIIIEDK